MSDRTTSPSRFSLLRRHPVVTLFVFVFFAAVLVVIVAQHWSAPAGPRKRDRRKINSYRIPPGMHLVTEDDLMAPPPAAVALMTAAIAAEPAPAPAPEAKENSLLFNAVTILTGIVVASLIAYLLSLLLVR